MVSIEKMASIEILDIIKKVSTDPSYEYMEDYKKLNLHTGKRSMIFRIRMENRLFEMNDWLNCFKKSVFYVAVKSNKLFEFIEFVRLNKITYIEIIISKAICNKKWFNHAELKSVRFYPYCKMSKPVVGYYCYPQFIDYGIKKIE